MALKFSHPERDPQGCWQPRGHGTLKSELSLADYSVGQSEDIVDFHVEDSEPFAAEDSGSLCMLAESLAHLAAHY